MKGGIKMEDHHIEKNSNWEDLDKNAAGLVEAMNRTGWIQIFMSCEGHLDPDRCRMPYVYFLCRVEKIDLLCEGKPGPESKIA